MLDYIKFKAKRKSGNREWLFSESIQKVPILNGFLVMLWLEKEGFVEVDQNTICIASDRLDANDSLLYSGDKIDKIGNVITWSIGSGFSINGDRPLYIFKRENMVFSGNIYD